jgi:serine protease Do
MIAGRGGPFVYGGEPWRVRVRSRVAAERILGAGVLLDREHVLTCAHVAMADSHLAVDMVGLDGVPSSDAWIVDGLCVPPRADEQRGDVALLKLSLPQPDGIAATLRRVALTWDRCVHALGYPPGSGLDIGVWARMTLAGRAGVEWLQMNRRSDGEQRVRAGFSGAGVADDHTGDVLGIVVSEYTDAAAGLSWMLPVEAIIAHLPLVSEWVVGDSGIDPIFIPPVRDAGRTDRAAELADWLARRHEGAAVLVVVGSDLAAVRQAVALSSPNTDQLGAVGGVVDLALDVGGRTVKEVSDRIVDRAGLAVADASTSSERLHAGTPPMTIVADGVDEAEQPDVLLGEVFKPLLDSGARLVLGFRHDDSPSLAMARTLAAGTVAARLNALAASIAALAEAGKRQPAVIDQAAKLRLGLTVLRGVAAEDAALVAGRLAKFERAVARLKHDLKVFDQRAETVSADLGLLEATKARAAIAGLVEDIELAAKYETAFDSLTTEPVDVAAAHATVHAYVGAVRRKLAEGQRQ